MPGLIADENDLLGRAQPSTHHLRWLVVNELDDLLAHPLQVGAEPDQHPTGDALALAD